MGTETLIAIGTGITGLIVGYLTAYLGEKGKNKALKQDIAKITDETEKVLATYRLDHEKRKFQFERKHEVYSRYHSLLDKFESSENPFSNKPKLDLMLTQMLNTIYANVNDQGKQMEAINKFADEFSGLIRLAFSGLKNIALETSEIKLVGSKEILEIVERFKIIYNKTENITDQIFKDPIKLHSGNEDLSSASKEISTLVQDINEMRAQIIMLMRQDLNNI